jgi:hypothetical protein
VDTWPPQHGGGRIRVHSPSYTNTHNDRDTKAYGHTGA